MEKAPRLQDVQAWLAWKISRSPKAEPKPSCAKAIASLPPLSVKRRMAIYSNAYILRLVESMSSDFEITARAVREDVMHALVQQYLQKYPSKYRSVSQVGCRFPQFLKSHPLRKQLAFLPDLAQLEWLLLESCLAPDSTPLGQTDIAEMADKMEDSLFHLAPSVRFLASHWNIFQVWNRRKASDKRFFTLPPKTRTHLMIWRNHGYSEPVIVEGPAYKMLHLLKRGMKFGEALEAMKNTPELETKLQLWFQDWMSKGLFVKWGGLNDRYRAAPV